MTIESTMTKEIYEGNGAATVFPVPFAYSRPEDIYLIFTDATGVETPITDNYRVEVLTGGETSVIYPVTGQPVTAGNKLTVYRQTPQKQIVDLIYGGAFNPEVLERDGFDRAVMMIQEVEEKADRAIKTAMSSTSNSDELAAEVFTARDEAVAAAGAAAQSEGSARNSDIQAAQSAANAKADANRAAAIVDPASLASSVFNVRKAFVLEEAISSGGVLTLPGYYYPTREVLFLMYEGTTCTPRLSGVEMAGAWQYEEIGTNPDVISNQVRIYFDASAGDVFDMWVVASAAGRNIEEIEALVAEAKAEADRAEIARNDAISQANRADSEAVIAEKEADRARSAANEMPDLAGAKNGQVIVAREVGGAMQAGYEDAPSAAVIEGKTTLTTPLPSGVSFAVPDYIVGANKLAIFVDGVRCEQGTSAASAMFGEVGEVGAISTSIIFYENIEAGTQITAVSAA